MYAFYNVLLIIGSIVALPFYFYRMLVEGKYRKSMYQRLGFVSKGIEKNLGGERSVWFHAVSVGEVLSSIPLINMVREQHPSLKIILSTVTETGNETAFSKCKGTDSIIFFPFDYPWAIRRVVNAVNPSLFVIIETDIWPNFLREMRRRHVPSLIVNCRISPRSHKRYRAFKCFFRKVLENISLYSMQSHVDSERITACGAETSRVVITGNLKFDQKIPSVTDVEKNRILDSMGVKSTQKVFMAGSTHRGEEEIVLDVFQEIKQEHPDMVLVLAPRNPERFKEVESIVSKRNLKWLKRTMCGKDCPLNSVEVIVLDTMGELAEMYSIGSLVFVGGSLVKTGGHNLLEPAAHKKVVMFGPYMDNFPEISRVLQESGGGIQVKDKDEFIFHAKRLLSDSLLLKDLGEKAYGVLEKNRGATLRNRDIINDFIVNVH